MLLKVPVRKVLSTAASRSSDLQGIRVSRPKKVLDEYKYNSDLKNIISRDYFSTKEAPDTPTLSLDQYQARFTSEDNNDFNDLIEAEDALKRQKKPWLYNQKKLTEGTVDQGLLEGSHSTADKSQKLLEYPPNSAQNALMFSPEAGSVRSHVAKSYASKSKKQIVKHNVHMPSNLGNSATVLGKISKAVPDELNGYRLINSPLPNSLRSSGDFTSGDAHKDIFKGLKEKRDVRKAELSPAAKRILQRVTRKS